MRMVLGRVGSNAGLGFRQVKFTRYTSTTTATSHFFSSNCFAAECYAIGPGGGGGGSLANGQSGGGGGGGACTYSFLTHPDIPNFADITVPVGGAPGTATGGSGSNPSQSTRLGNIVHADKGGGGNGNSATIAGSTPGGTGGQNTATMPGQLFWNGRNGGAGLFTTTANFLAGEGGGNIFGGGPKIVSGTGASATSPGCGGTGAGTTGAGSAGGMGADGLIIIYEYLR